MNNKLNHYEIPACNMEVLNEKLERLNRKAKKLGVAPITTRVHGHQVVKKTERNELGEVIASWNEVIYLVAVEGIAPKLPGGWTFIGTLEHTPAGNICRSIPGQEMPESYRSVPAGCAHCSLKRRRKDTYLVRDEAGEYRQVGHNCVADYLGGSSPEHIALLAEVIRIIRGGCGEEGFSFGREPSKVLAGVFMSMAAACVLAKGYTSKAASKAYAEKAGHGLQTTTDLAWVQLFPPKPLPKGWETIEITEAAIELGLAALEHAKAMTGQKEYEYNLRTTSSLEFYERRHAGLMASAISCYQRAQGQIAERKNAATTTPSEHIGEIGKRAVYALTVVGEHAFANNYGYGDENRILYRMKDSAGNVFAWWTVGAKLEVGKTYEIKGTVKKHDDYKGVKQTVLSRCIVIEDKVAA